MAAMFTTSRNAPLIRFSKSLPSLHKPSRLAFNSSASNSIHSNWRNASAAAKGSRGSAVRAYDSTQARQDAEKIEESAKETLSKGVGDLKDFSQDVKAKTEDLAASVADKTKEGTNRVAETAESVNESAKKYAYETKDKAEEAAGSVADKTNEVAGSVKDALEDAGEKAKQSAEGAWETAKDATQNVKETVVGKDE